MGDPSSVYKLHVIKVISSCMGIHTQFVLTVILIALSLMNVIVLTGKIFYHTEINVVFN